MTTLTPRELEEPMPREADRLSELGEAQLRGLAQTLEWRNQRLQEALLGQLSLEIDNIGWKPIDGARAVDNGFDLAHIKKQAEMGMALTTINPLVKRGVAVRTNYIWGAGVSLEYPANAPYARSLRRTVGKVGAQFELERTLASTGNLLIEVAKDNQNRVRIVPMEHVDGASATQDDPSVIGYVRLSYDVWRTATEGAPPTSAASPTGTAENVRVWVPTTELDRPPVDNIGDVRVDKSRVIKVISINRMANWWWGVPDLYAVSFWVRAYKKYLEQCAVLNEAYAQIAYKVSSATTGGVDRISAEMASNPGVDPVTGQPTGVGGTAVGADVIPVQHGRPVDFGNGLPLAAMVAAGLEIPLQVMTSDASNGGSRASDVTLDEATKKAMQARQRFLGDELDELAEQLGLADGFKIEWPRVGEEPLHRTIQAVDQAGRTGMLYPEEYRDEILKALGRTSDKEKPPTEDELPVVVQVSNGEEPAQVEPPSYGDKTLRDEPGMQQHTNET